MSAGWSGTGQPGLSSPADRSSPSTAGTIDAFQTPADDRLALFAFTIYAESVAEDSGAAREALLRGLESINGGVRAEAARRLGELERLVQAEASIAAQGLQ